MLNANTWELPFGEAAELELSMEWGQLSLQPVEPGGTPRVELTGGSSELEHSPAVRAAYLGGASDEADDVA